MTLTIREVLVSSAEARGLMRELDADLQARYPGALIHSIDLATFHGSGGIFLVGDADGVPVVCGALRPLEPGFVEVKRMFVRAEARRRGFARAMLEALEARARSLGALTIRLETGDRQPEAVCLYLAAGYAPIPCYGEYDGSPHSLCFEKRIAAIDQVR